MSLFSLDLIFDVVCSIGNVLQRMAKYEAALENLNKSLEIKIRMLSHEHPVVADTKVWRVLCNLHVFLCLSLHVLLQKNIGIVLGQQSKLEEATQMYNETLQIRLKVFGEDSLQVADIRKDIADIRKTQGQYNEALEMYNGVVKIQEHVLGHEHLDTANTRENIAIVYHGQGKHAEALELFTQVLAVKEKVLGLEHLDVATIYHK